MITLATIKSELPQFLVNLGIAGRLADWTYWAQTRLLSTFDFWWNKDISTITTIASQAEYHLSHRCNGKSVTYMGDQDNQGLEILPISIEEIYRYDSTPTDTGDPEYYAPVCIEYVQATTDSASVVTAVSSDDADMAISLVVRGQVSGVEQYETISLSGTTTATGTLSFDAGSIRSVNLASVCAGAVTVTADSTTIASIPPGLLRLECTKVRLWRVPGSVLTLPYIFHKKPMKAANDSAIIDIIDEAFEALMLGIEYYGHKNNGDVDYARTVKEEFNVEVAKLYSWSTNELRKVLKKDFSTIEEHMLFTLPKTVTYTVT